MKRFSQLYEALDGTTSTNAKVAAMVRYFRETAPADAAWGLYFLTGQRPRRLVSGRHMARWCMEELDLPGWLFEDCYAAVGDIAETVALLLDGTVCGTQGEDLPLSEWMHDRLLPLRGLHELWQRSLVVGWWRQLDRRQTFLLGKLLTGELRVGVSRTLAQRAMAEVAGVEPAVMAHRLMGSWEPTGAAYGALLDPGDTAAEDLSRPYPFFLASPLEAGPDALGDPHEWLAEPKWDGIRAQVVRRGGRTWTWSRGEELVTDRFPEVATEAETLPDGTVLDGELLAFRDGAPLGFAVMQRRTGRKKLGPKVLRDAPVAFMAFDVLEDGGRDLRQAPLLERRAALLVLLASSGPALRVSPSVGGETWESRAQEREHARERGVEGLMLKRLSSTYQSGRRRGDWWKWKVDPYTVDAVLIYAHAGHGKRSNLFTDYTFGVWSDGELVPVTRAYSGLDDEEIARLDAWIRRSTLDRFGITRRVPPVHVFELAFEGIAESRRHRAGVALRFPRIHRWRTDKKPEEADSLGTLRRLLR